MNWAKITLSLVLVAGLPVVSHAEEADKTEKSDDEAAKKKKVDSVDFRKLKELLPEELVGVKRTKAEGRKVTAGDFSVSQVDARYEKDADKDDAPHITVLIMDYGSHQELANATASWTHADIDQENDDGYARTVKIAGQPGYETWEKENKSGTMQIYVTGRFLITMTLENLPAEAIQKAAKALPIEKYAALAKEMKKEK